MAAKVLDFDLAKLPVQVTGLEGYSSALCLLRISFRPVARVELPVRHGQINGGELREAVMAQLGPDLLDAWLEKLIGPENASAGKIAPVTIAICTRDRPHDLRNCLESLRRLPDDGQEILVVDNCPASSAAREVVRTYPTVRYLREDRPGLNCARNRALREARGSWVAFIDDDAAADEHWLRALAANFDGPLTLCVTGLTMPAELETEAQETFENLAGFCRGFRRRTFGLATHQPVAGGAVGAGANMALRRDVLEAVGAFDEALDAGTATHSGGDSDMFSRILAAGYDIVYEPSALNWHRHRRTWPELRRTMFGYGVGLYAAWTRSLFIDRDWEALRAAWRWLARVQSRRLARSFLRRPGAYPLDLIMAEIAGSMLGPWAYWKSRRQLATNLRHQ